MSHLSSLLTPLSSFLSHHPSLLNPLSSLLSSLLTPHSAILTSLSSPHSSLLIHPPSLLSDQSFLLYPFSPLPSHHSSLFTPLSHPPLPRNQCWQGARLPQLLFHIQLWIWGGGAVEVAEGCGVMAGLGWWRGMDGGVKVVTTTKCRLIFSITSRP